MSAVLARSLDRLAAVIGFGVLMVVMPYFLQAVPRVVGFGVLAVVMMTVRMKMSIAYASALGIPRADVDASDFLTKIPFRNACKMACCKHFPAYVG